MENLFGSPAGYVIIIVAVIVIVYIPIVVIFSKKRKQIVKNFIEENPTASKMYTKTKNGVTSEALEVVSINGEKPIWFQEGLKGGFYLIPGKTTIEVNFSWTRPGVMYKTVTKSIGVQKLEVDVDVNRKYEISYDRKEEEFHFTEITE